MNRILFTKSLLLTVFIVVVHMNQCLAVTHVWLVVGVPSPKPELGFMFSTTLGIAAWNGNPGAVDFTIHHDPNTLRVVNIRLTQDPLLVSNCYIDSTSNTQGHTRIVCFQDAGLLPRDTLFALGNISWKVVGVAGSMTDISIEVEDVVEIDRSPVEVFAFGQHIQFYTGEDLGVPKFYDLHYNYPNPFNSSTAIPYQIPAKSHVSIRIYNVLGQLVATLVDEERPLGNYIVEWKGDNNSGNQVATGVYFYRMRAGTFAESKKMLLLR